MSRAIGFLRDRAWCVQLGHYELLGVFGTGLFGLHYSKGEWGVTLEFGWFGLTIRDTSHPGFVRWKRLAQQAQQIAKCRGLGAT